VINDPGTSKNVRKIFPRKNLAHAWAYSHNTAYLIYPEGADVPRTDLDIGIRDLSSKDYHPTLTCARDNAR